MPVYPVTAGDFNTVSIRLEPVGANWSCPSPLQLRYLTSSLLLTLQVLHDLGYVHRDIRHENILAVLSGWMLIDWELAAPVGSPVFWHGPAVPPTISLGASWGPRHDIWQLGLLLHNEPSKTPPAEEFAQQLLTGQLSSASAALEALRTWPHW